MRTREIDLEKLEKFVNSKDWVRLSETQRGHIHSLRSGCARWRRDHPIADVSLSILPFFVLLSGFVALFFFVASSNWSEWAMGLVFGLMHGWLSYSFVVFSLHEWATHRNDRGKLSVVAGNACRLFGADPVYYRENHHDHHRFLGTSGDKTFTNWVGLRRYLFSILPGVPILGLSDFFVHSGPKWTASKRLTLFLTLSTLAIETFVLSQTSNSFWAWIGLFAIAPTFGNFLDRSRDVAEHVFRPADSELGSRDFGLGLLGWIICGGPWGQPFHLTHHLIPSLPWYQQIYVGRNLRTILNPDQVDASPWIGLFLELRKAKSR